ncbi:beta-class carbonic anhydrase [Anaerovorax odorimutans]|uniref:beta-class carbonic anhydrase n=1 Tax=Anaerovorax odorimutans TaxID=109327 RepID=UPI00041D20E8|nr:carbonic anhydrase [Anaerovorax odorimutans]
MNRIEEILEFNKSFVENKDYENYITTKYPNKKIAILSCMDTRLIELLPAALNLKNGDAKIIKNAGGIITHPFGSVIRSLLVAIYELNVEDIMVIGHYDCGMQGLDSEKLVNKMLARQISQDKINMIKYCGVDFKNWLKGFDDAETSVLETVNIIRNHPLIPSDVNVHGFIMDPNTGKLEKL